MSVTRITAFIYTTYIKTVLQYYYWRHEHGATSFEKKKIFVNSVNIKEISIAFLRTFYKKIPDFLDYSV
jgi:hypothetical protein